MTEFRLNTRLRGTLTSIQDALRESHPMGRKPQFLRPHSAPWISVYALRQMRTASFFVPGMLLYLCWPFAVEALVDWKNGVYVESRTPSELERPKPNSSKLRRRIMLQQGPRVLNDSTEGGLTAAQGTMGPYSSDENWYGSIENEYHSLGAYAIV